MLLDYEYRKYESVLYSSGTDLLLSWGKADMFHPHDNGFASETKDEWMRLAEKSDMVSLLNSGLESLTRDVDEALNFLCTHSSPEFDGEDAAKLHIALKIFDHVILLSQAARNFPEQDHFPKDFQIRMEDLFREITLDRAPSYLRLIPLNHWRRELRGHIPEHGLHLFPWYGEWADLPSEAIEIMIENWNEVRRGNFECSEMDAETLKALFSELPNDPGLMNYISEEARFADILSRSVRKSLGLRLLDISDKEAGNHAISETVDEKGLVACACHIVRSIKDKLRSEEARLEGMLWAALCGPLMEDRDRLNLITRVEDRLTSLDVSTLRSGSLLDELCQWSQENTPDEVFSRKVFEPWMESLNKAAKVVTESVPEEAAVFLRAVRELEVATIETKTIGEQKQNLEAMIFVAEVFRANMMRTLLKFSLISALSLKFVQQEKKTRRGSRMSAGTSKSEPLEIPASFRLSEQSLINLGKEGIPEQIIAELEALKDQRYPDKEKFMGALNAVIGEDEIIRYKPLILKHANIAGNFFEMEIKSDDGWLELLSPETAGDENLVRICDFMEDKIYFRGLLVYEEDRWQALGEVKSETGMPLETDDPEKDILLLCIGLDEDAVSDALGKAVSVLNASADIGSVSEESETTSLPFAWICYQVTRNGD